MSERVLVAMSGGVDSSVAASLLLEQGFDVVGVTLRMWEPTGDEPPDSCGGEASVASARAVAENLSIQHRVVNACDAFEAQVLRPAWEDYAGGRTPNPCLVCNRVVKFQRLCELAGELDAQWIATGHHARILREDGAAWLRRGRDRHKDQSYFLALLGPAQLAVTRFPVGNLTKAEVREHARARGLASADRPESQDACFSAGDDGFAEALRLRFGAPERPGVIVDPAGRELGRHPGIHRFTIGQRRGTGVSLGRRAFVTRIRADSNEVLMSDRVDDLLAERLCADRIQWSAGPAPSAPFACEAQYRYRTPAVGATVSPLPDQRAQVVFDEPQRALTPGQAVVFYDGDRVLGGGWISRTGR
jgi:tRNA-specific 2-thiouridylase